MVDVVLLHGDSGYPGGRRVAGLSTLSGNHLDEVPATVAALRTAGSTAVVVVGGAIPPADAAPLLAAVFATGSPLTTVIASLEQLLAPSGERDEEFA